MFCTTCNHMINVKTNWRTGVGMLIIGFLVSNINARILGTKSQYIFSSVVAHDLNVVMHTFLPFPCHMLWTKYDAHVAWMYFYKFHICYLLLPQTFCFEYFGWYSWVFFNNDHAMKVIMNVYFLQICKNFNHTWLCILTKKLIRVAIVSVM